MAATGIKTVSAKICRGVSPMTRKSDKLLEKVGQIGNKFMWKQFTYRKSFKLVCVIKPKTINTRQRKLVVVGSPSEKDMNRACVYVMVVAGRIFKIGQTSVGIKQRIESYNCGQKRFRKAGTASVTNYWTLQSLTNIGKNIHMYCLFPKQKKYTFFGVSGKTAFPPAKNIEKIIINKIEKKHGKKPIGCTQR